MAICTYTDEEKAIIIANYHLVMNKSNQMLNQVNQNPYDIVRRSNWVDIDTYLNSPSSDYLNLPEWIADLLSE